MVLPRLGLGMAALGRPGYINLDRSQVFSEARSIEKMQKQANLVLDELFRSAPSPPWIDCARSYGLSEKFVGEYLHGNKIDPKDVYVSSKWGYTYVADWNIALAPGEPHEVKDHSTDNFIKQLKETDELIGDYVNLYQIHSATFESGILNDATAHRALADCRKDKGWALGLSVSGPKQNDIIREAMKIEVDGERLFDSVQCTYNLLEQRPVDALREASEAGMDIIIKEGLANGRVLYNEIVQQYAKRLDVSADQLALGAILALDFGPRVLLGAVTEEQLSSNLEAIKVAEKLKVADWFDDLIAEVKVASESYWDDRAALAWN